MSEATKKPGIYGPLSATKIDWKIAWSILVDLWKGIHYGMAPGSAVGA